MSSAMPDVMADTNIADAILNWDFKVNPDAIAQTTITSHKVGDVRISDVGGPRCTGHRTDDHRQLDGGAYFGIVCKLDGEELVHSAGQELVLQPRDILVWQNAGRLEFTVDEWSRKLIMLVPEARFRTILKHPLCGNSFFISGLSLPGNLVASTMSALASNLDPDDDAVAESAIDMTLDLIGSAIEAGRNQLRVPRRSTLYTRILQFIDRRLEEEDLSPPMIAAAHGISTRYLHLLFANEDATVSGWIRERRLLRCREEIERARRGLSFTEIAHLWGFSDSAHFSRSFKKRYGLSPSEWRSRHRG